MIKIGQIDSKLKEKFYETACPFYIDLLKNIHDDKEYKKLIDYLEFKIDDKIEYNNEKMRNLLIGGRESLVEIIDIVGPKQSSTFANDCYKRFADTDLMRSWARDINVVSCPYCNLNYVNSSSDSSTRSEFDHYYPKSIFPYLCISLYNLVPCCHDCNQIKGNFNSYLNPFTYPFLEEYGEKIIFDVDILKDGSITNNVNPLAVHRIGIEIIDISKSLLPESIKNEAAKLKLKEKYLSKSFDISIMYNKVIMYNNSYRLSIRRLKIFKRFSPDPFVFCGVVSKENWLSTTMSKINFDIFNKYKK